MKIHEYQGKQLFRIYGVPVLRGLVCHTPEAAEAAARELGSPVVVVKSQIHAGGRGKGTVYADQAMTSKVMDGGVKVVKSPAEAKAMAAKLLGNYLKTIQTGDGCKQIQALYVEDGCRIAKELYVSILMDRAASLPVLIVSSEGGMDIEEIAAKHPDKILKAVVDPAAGLQAYQCREIGYALGLKDKQVAALTRMMQSLYHLYCARDLNLVEINPLAIVKDGELIALDAKIQVDDSALYRQKVLEQLRDPSQDDPKEQKAREHGLNYIALEGNIGCMVNGAGLAMATMDLIKLHGGQPANFLDVGGGTTAEKVAEAFKLILSDKNVRAILVNIFGGIVRCDLIAEGIIQAVKEVGIEIPVVVRLEGTNADQGRALLKSSGLKIIAADSLTRAAQQVVAAV